MRYLIFVMAIIVVNPLLYAAETSVGLDCCVVLNDASNQSAESIVAVYFDTPNAITGKEIIFAMLTFSFTLQNPPDSSNYELMMFPATDEWSEESIDFDEAITLSEDVMISSFAVKLENNNEFHLDLTNYVKEIVDGGRSNFGLFAFADLLGDNNLRLSGNLGNAIKNAANLRIVYK